MALKLPWAPLGWKQLRHKPLRLLVAVAGIAFAVLLIMMQLGFRAALFESTLRFHERFRYDIALFSPDSVFIVRPAAFSIRRLYQALGDEAVADVSPVYIFPAVWKNPWGTDRRAIATALSTTLRGRHRMTSRIPQRCRCAPGRWRRRCPQQSTAL
mgnify:CR=1 FL=1